MYGDNTSQSPSARGIRTVKNVGNWKDRRIGRRKENRERKKRGRKIFDFSQFNRRWQLWHCASGTNRTDRETDQSDNRSMVSPNSQGHEVYNWMNSGPLHCSRERDRVWQNDTIDSVRARASLTHSTNAETHAHTTGGTKHVAKQGRPGDWVITYRWSRSQHGVYFRRMSSPIGLNTQLCCERYNVSLYSFSFIDTELIRHFVFSDLSNYQSNAGIIYELLLAKSGLQAISSLCVADMDFIIHYLRVS